MRIYQLANTTTSSEAGPSTESHSIWIDCYSTTLNTYSKTGHQTYSFAHCILSNYIPSLFEQSAYRLWGARLFVAEYWPRTFLAFLIDDSVQKKIVKRVIDLHWQPIRADEEAEVIPPFIYREGMKSVIDRKYSVSRHHRWKELEVAEDYLANLQAEYAAKTKQVRFHYTAFKIVLGIVILLLFWRQYY